MPAFSIPPPMEPFTPNPHGQAALTLVESLIHIMISNHVLSVQQAVAAMELAVDTQIALADAGRSPQAATFLLEGLLRSLETDLPNEVS